MYYLVFQVASFFLQMHAILSNDMERKLSFEVGHLIEYRCFLIGYRGAWFRCKVESYFHLERLIIEALEC